MTRHSNVATRLPVALILIAAGCLLHPSNNRARAFVVPPAPVSARWAVATSPNRPFHRRPPFVAPVVVAAAVLPDLDVIALVAGQENYGLAVVCVGEGMWSFLQAPSLSNVAVLVPPVLAAGILTFVSGPMITSTSGGDVATVGTGLWIATAVSVLLGISYVFRLLAPSYSSSAPPKEIAAFGLLVAVAGLVSFGQNLIVDGFVTLPSIELPSLPHVDLDF